MVRRPRRQSKTANPNGSLSIVLVDGTRIREEIKREYEKLRRDLDTAREQAERFQKRDLPNFSRWVNRQFGTLLTELRETTRRVHELQRLFLEVQTEILMSGASPSQAYSRVNERRNNPPETPEDDEFDGGAGGRSEFDARSEESGPDFEQSFGSGKSKVSAQSRFPTKLGRLKELYRTLARRLHPDVQKEMTAQKQEWWHQAQTAYETGDVQQLEVILTLCEIDETGSTARTSLSALQRISAQLRRSLRQMKAELAKYRRDPAWNFNQRKPGDMAATLERQLNYDLRLMKERLQEMELQMAAMINPRRGRSPRAPRRAIFDPLEFLF